METATKTVWTIDPTHSEIQFKVKHLVISTVTGHFRTFEGTVETVEDDFETATVKFSADTASVDTNQLSATSTFARLIFSTLKHTQK